MGFFNDYYIDLLGFSAGFFSQKVEFITKIGDKKTTNRKVSSIMMLKKR
jgi:hypothetical protein